MDLCSLLVVYAYEVVLTWVNLLICNFCNEGFVYLFFSIIVYLKFL